MASFTTTDALLQELVSKLRSSKNPSEYLHSKLLERAHSISTQISAEKDDDEKAHRGIVGGLPQICATDSDVDVSQQPAATEPNPYFSLDSHVVGELLPLVKEGNVFGREAEKEQVLSRLLSADQRRPRPQLAVIPIVGKDGMGKTTLAREIYEDPTVREHFELKAWVKIDGQRRSHHQLFDIARKLLKSAVGMLCSFNSLVEMHEMVVDTLLSHRSLIVLDDFDLMEAEQWANMKLTWFRFVGVGSKVVVTARNFLDAEETVGGGMPAAQFYVKKLSEHDSWRLYSSLAFSSLCKSKEREDDASCLRLAELCQGVPLSLKLLGSLMRFERSCSSDLMERIIAAAPPEDVDSFVLLITILSLPNHLFNCFAYCGIFPYGYVPEKEKLIKTWIANDVVVGPSTGMSVEEIGEAYFHQLLCRSFFTDITCNEYGEIVEAQMVKVVHEYARIVAQIVYGDKAAYALGVDANSSVLSMAMPFQKPQYSPKSLQTLVSFSPKSAPPPPPIHITQPFIELKRLRSLDLSKTGIRNLSKHVCALQKLRYLNLSHTPLTKLPKSITTLTRLETLDLSRCYYLKALPRKTSNLSKLRHLDLSHCNSLTRTPSGIGRLNSLITMPLYVVGERDSKCASLKDLSKLKKLRGVLRITHLENVKEIGQARAADLKQKKLHQLGLCWSHGLHECGKVLEFLEPNPEVRVLELRGYEGSRFPSWMPNLGCLVKLLINDCKFSTLLKLGELQLLKDLELREMVNIKSLGQEFYGSGYGDFFPSLEKLKIHDMPNLKNWSEAGQGTGHSSSSNVFRKLKKLSIQGCPQLQNFPSQPPSVMELVVWGSHGEILPWVTRASSLSSIVVNDMHVEEPLKGSCPTNSVKKLIVVRSTDLDVLESCHLNKFASLEHLRVLHCLNLRHVYLSRLGSLEKLDVVDCQNLERIDIITEDFTLTEIMIEDCPRITTVNITAYSGSTSSLRKLVVRNCPEYSISHEKIQELKGLEFLYKDMFIAGFPERAEGNS